MSVTLVILVALLTCAAASEEKKIVCYIDGASAYRKGNESFSPANLDPHLCTHVIYLAARLADDGTIRARDPFTDLPDNAGKDGYNFTNQLRSKNPNLKTLVKLEYYFDNLYIYNKMISANKIRPAFVSNIVNFVKKYDFNGLDFDWDFYRHSGDPTKDKNFALLLKELRDAFDTEQLILSTQVLGHVKDFSSYDIVNTAKYPHFINLVVGFHVFCQEGVTNSNAPLYAGSWEEGDNVLLNVAATTYYWLSQGAPAEKLVIAIRFFGSNYTLEDSSNTAVGAPAVAYRFKSLTHADVCKKLLLEKWSIRFNEQQRISYAFKDDMWMSYESVKSIQEKAKFVKRLGLGGLLAWTVDRDDFKGACGTTYPLLTAMNQELQKSCLLPEDASGTCLTRFECINYCECTG